MAKTNYNGSSAAAASATVAAENNARRSFFFQNVSDTDMVLNFGAAATAANILTIVAGASMFFDKHSPYPIEKQINVFCSAVKSYQAQADE
jgi:hypothetical protein